MSSEQTSKDAANLTASPDPSLVIFRSLPGPMADGVRLFGDLYLPGKDGAPDLSRVYDTLMIRTPYGRTTPDQAMTAKVYTAHGYAVFIQDARGSGESDGVMEPMRNESWGANRDGADTLAWLCRQRWCSGRVVTAGPSYLGGVQLLLAAMAPPGLETCFVQMPAVNGFDGNWVYTDGGMLDLLTAAPWADMMAKAVISRASPIAPHEPGAAISLPDFIGFAQSTRGTALRDIPTLKDVPFWQDWLDHWDEPAFFAVTDAISRLSNVSRPLLLYGGWFDLFLKNTINAYAAISRNAATPAARTDSCLIIGPWAHGIPLEGSKAFPNSGLDYLSLGTAWMNHRLHGAPSPFRSPVTLYVMGENRWRAEAAWPLPDTHRTRFHLHSGGHANGVAGDGRLSTERPAPDQPADCYRSDPADPVPFRGGHSLVGGCLEQTPIEARDDVLVYSTPPLEEDVEVTGEVSATLFAATTATDTDWHIKLVDVFPDGTACNVAQGGLRARYRLGRTVPRAVVPGEVGEYRVSLWATSNVFKKGHRIRVMLSSSDFPNTDINPNRFMDLTKAGSQDHVVAEQTIFHDARRPSFVELPIIPQSRAREWIDPPFPAPPLDPANFTMPVIIPVEGKASILPG